jgi:hypothetical protein
VPTQIVNSGERLGKITGASDGLCRRSGGESEVKIMSARKDPEQILAWERCR